MSVMKSSVRVVLAALGLSAAMAAAAQAQIGFTEYRAADGTTYEVLSASELGGGAENLRITTVAGSIAGGTGCSTPGNMSGDAISAIGGVVSPGMSLQPYNLISRTIILNGDPSTVSFNSTFGGRVQIGTGGGAQNVCGAAFDCTGQPNVATLVGLDSATGGIPAACIAGTANDLTAGCGGGSDFNTFAFGVPATGSPPVCTSSSSVTVNTTVCAAQPADGFTLGDNQIVVFVYGGNLASLGFTVAAGGFGISTDTVNNPGCMNPPSVVSSSGRSDSQPAPPPPSPTPTSTATVTATFTLTPTNTPTNTNTPTSTFTATPTFTATNTATPSNTRTNTPTPTNTPPPTNTRPPIPVVPSPTSPAGLVMVFGLGGGLLWALRRMGKTR